MRFEWLDAIVPQNFRLRTHPQHKGNVRAVNIGVEQTDFVPHLFKCNGKIDGQRGLTDATFSRSDGDDGFYSRQGLWSRWLLARAGRHGSVQRVTFSFHYNGRPRRRWCRGRDHAPSTRDAQYPCSSSNRTLPRNMR